MRVKNVQEALQRAEDKLRDLEEEKDRVLTKLNEKIKAARTEVDKYSGLVKAQEMKAAEQVFHSNGLTIQEIMEAVEKGDFSLLQQKIEEVEPVNEPETVHSVTLAGEAG